MKRFLFLIFTALALNLTTTAQEDSTRITEWEDTVEATETRTENEISKISRDISFGEPWGVGEIVVVITLGFPVLIVFIAFYFQYKNRKARYKLAEQALAAGQPIPEGFVKGKDESNTLSKGIQHICVGLGLFIFLWAMTTFAIGTIGLLIMFIGFGQVIIYYVNNGKNDK